MDKSRAYATQVNANERAKLYRKKKSILDDKLVQVQTARKPKREQVTRVVAYGQNKTVVSKKRLQESPLGEWSEDEGWLGEGDMEF